MGVDILQAKEISKKFKTNKKEAFSRRLKENWLVALDKLSLSLKEGEIYGLLGPNGAGKTTALRIMASLLTPDAGEILYRGENVRKDVSSYRKKIGFLTSELKLDDFFTPEYTFTYMAKLYGEKDEDIEKRRKLLFERFGITSFSNSKIASLSTGMKQKTSLAISLCHNPEIIIFDEPTNGLDIIASKDVEDFLIDLRNEGKCLIISTHIFSLVEKLCDRVGILLSGHLVKEGYLKELTEEKSLEDLFFSLLGEQGQ